MKCHLIIGLCLWFLLSGCSVSSVFYVRNLRSTSAQVLITYQHELRRDSLPYEENVKPLRFSSAPELSKKLSYQRVNPNQILVTLPPSSTVLLGWGHNSTYFLVDQVHLVSSSTTYPDVPSVGKQPGKSAGIKRRRRWLSGQMFWFDVLQDANGKDSKLVIGDS